MLFARIDSACKTGVGEPATSSGNAVSSTIVSGWPTGTWAGVDTRVWTSVTLARATLQRAAGAWDVFPERPCPKRATGTSNASSGGIRRGIPSMLASAVTPLPNAGLLALVRENARTRLDVAAQGTTLAGLRARTGTGRVASGGPCRLGDRHRTGRSLYEVRKIGQPSPTCRRSTWRDVACQHSARWQHDT